MRRVKGVSLLYEWLFRQMPRTLLTYLTVTLAAALSLWWYLNYEWLLNPELSSLFGNRLFLWTAIGLLLLYSAGVVIILRRSIPGEIVSMIRMVYRGSSMAARQHAVSQMAATEDKRCVPWLLAYLRKRINSEEIRETIVSELPRFRTRTAVPLLIDIIRDSLEQDDLKGYCITALGTLGDTRATNLLVEALDTREKYSAHLAGAAATSLQSFGGQPRVRAALTKALEDPDLQVVGPAITSLGKLREKSSTPALIKILQNSAEYPGDIRGAAATSLQRMGTVEAVPILIEALGDSDMRVVGTSITSLGMIRDRRAVAALINVLLDHQRYTGDIRGAAATALYLLRDSSAVPALIEALNDYDPRVVGTSITSLGYLQDQRAVSPLTAVLADQTRYSGRQRGTAATALMNLRAVEAIPALVDALEDRDLDVVGASVTALGMLRDRRAIEPLVRTLKDRARLSGHIRGVTATALGNLGAQEAVPALVEALSDSDPDVLGTAISSLGRLKAVVAYSLLVNTAQDASKSIRLRRAAGLSLLRIDLPAAKETIKQRIIDDPEAPAELRLDMARLCNMNPREFRTAFETEKSEEEEEDE